MMVIISGMYVKHVRRGILLMIKKTLLLSVLMLACLNLQAQNKDPNLVYPTDDSYEPMSVLVSALSMADFHVDLYDDIDMGAASFAIQICTASNMGLLDINALLTQRVFQYQLAYWKELSRTLRVSSRYMKELTIAQTFNISHTNIYKS